MNPREIERLYRQHHSAVTDRRAVSRLVKLMREFRAHKAKCTNSTCPVNLHAFIAGHVVNDTAFNQVLLDIGWSEDDAARQHTLERTFVRVYVASLGRFVNGELVEENHANVAQIAGHA